MKRIGILGGLGPEATLYYYRVLIDLCHERPEANENYPEIIIYSLNLDECRGLMELGDWAGLAAKLVSGLQSLGRAGVHFGLIEANTPHIVFDDVKSRSPVPLLNIVEETCTVISGLGLTRVGLVGTKITMEAHFYQDVFDRKNISIVTPGLQDQAYIYKKIVTELGLGIILEDTRKDFLSIIQRMIDEESIEGLVLGCTEIPLLLTNDALGISFFDTSRIHAEAAFRHCLSET